MINVTGKLKTRDCEHDRFVVGIKRSDRNTHFDKICGSCKLLLSRIDKTLAKTFIGNEALDFGQHKGRLIKEIPRDYLEFLASQAGEMGDKIHFYLHGSVPVRETKPLEAKISVLT